MNWLHFQGRGVKCQGHMRSSRKSYFMWYLPRQLRDLHKTLHGNSLWQVDDLVRFLTSWDQRSRLHKVILKQFMQYLSRIFRDLQAWHGNFIIIMYHGRGIGAMPVLNTQHNVSSVELSVLSCQSRVYAFHCSFNMFKEILPSPFRYYQPFYPANSNWVFQSTSGCHF